MEDKEKLVLTQVPPTQAGYRWVAITAMLYAIGIILHTVSPNVGGVTPNWTIAMYAIVINLVRPTLGQALGMGLIAGITLVPSSKSAFPLGNLASEICGATTCWLAVQVMWGLGMRKTRLRPLISGFIATCFSGGVFTFILKLVLGLPLKVWIYAMLPVVATVGVLNGFVTMALFGPVARLFRTHEGAASDAFGAEEMEEELSEELAGATTGALAAETTPVVTAQEAITSAQADGAKGGEA